MKKFNVFTKITALIVAAAFFWNQIAWAGDMAIYDINNTLDRQNADQSTRFAPAYLNSMSAVNANAVSVMQDVENTSLLNISSEDTASTQDTSETLDLKGPMGSGTETETPTVAETIVQDVDTTDTSSEDASAMSVTTEAGDIIHYKGGKIDKIERKDGSVLRNIVLDADENLTDADITCADGSVQVFRGGKIESVTTVDGTVYFYTDEVLTSIKYEDGRIAAVAHVNDMTIITDNEKTVTYDASNHLKQVKFGDEKQIDYENGIINKITDKDKGVFTFNVSADDNGNVISSISCYETVNGTIYRYQTDVNGELVLITTEKNGITASYDNDGQLLSISKNGQEITPDIIADMQSEYDISVGIYNEKLHYREACQSDLDSTENELVTKTGQKDTALSQLDAALSAYENALENKTLIQGEYDLACESYLAAENAYDAAKNELDNSRANETTAKNALMSAQNEVITKKAVLEKKISERESIEKNIENLNEDIGNNENELETAKSELAVAVQEEVMSKADYDRAIAEVVSKQKAYDSARATTESERAEVDNAQKVLDEKGLDKDQVYRELENVVSDLEDAELQRGKKAADYQAAVAEFDKAQALKAAKQLAYDTAVTNYETAKEGLNSAEVLLVQAKSAENQSLNDLSQAKTILTDKENTLTEKAAARKVAEDTIASLNRELNDYEAQLSTALLELEYAKTAEQTAQTDYNDALSLVAVKQSLYDAAIADRDVKEGLLAQSAAEVQAKIILKDNAYTDLNTSIEGLKDTENRKNEAVDSYNEATKVVNEASSVKDAKQLEYDISCSNCANAQAAFDTACESLDKAKTCEQGTKDTLLAAQRVAALKEDTLSEKTALRRAAESALANLNTELEDYQGQLYGAEQALSQAMTEEQTAMSDYNESQADVAAIQQAYNASIADRQAKEVACNTAKTTYDNAKNARISAENTLSTSGTLKLLSYTENSGKITLTQYNNFINDQFNSFNSSVWYKPQDSLVTIGNGTAVLKGTGKNFNSTFYANQYYKLVDKPVLKTTFSVSSTGGQFIAAVDGYLTKSSATYLRIGIVVQNGKIYCQRVSGTSTSTLATLVASAKANTNYNLEFEMSKTNIKIYIWENSAQRPSAASYTYSLSDFETVRPYFSVYSGTASIDYVGVKGQSFDSSYGSDSRLTKDVYQDGRVCTYSYTTSGITVSEYKRYLDVPYSLSTPSLWTKPADSLVAISNGVATMTGTGSNYNAKFSSNQNLLRDGSPVFRTDFQVTSTSGQFIAALDGYTSGNAYKQAGIIVQNGKIYFRYINNGTTYTSSTLVSSVKANTKYTVEYQISGNNMSIYVWQSSSQKPSGAQYVYSVSDWVNIKPTYALYSGKATLSNMYINYTSQTRTVLSGSQEYSQIMLRNQLVGNLNNTISAERTAQVSYSSAVAALDNAKKIESDLSLSLMSETNVMIEKRTALDEKSSQRSSIETNISNLNIKITDINQRLDQAQQGLEDALNAEVTAKDEYKEACNAVILSQDECEKAIKGREEAEITYNTAKTELELRMTEKGAKGSALETAINALESAIALQGKYALAVSAAEEALNNAKTIKEAKQAAYDASCSAYAKAQTAYDIARNEKDRAVLSETKAKQELDCAKKISDGKLLVLNEKIEVKQRAIDSVNDLNTKVSTQKELLVASEADLDDAELAEQNAQIDFDTAKSNVENIQADYDSAVKERISAESVYNTSKSQLEIKKSEKELASVDLQNALYELDQAVTTKNTVEGELSDAEKDVNDVSALKIAKQVVYDKAYSAYLGAMTAYNIAKTDLENVITSEEIAKQELIAAGNVSDEKSAVLKQKTVARERAGSFVEGLETKLVELNDCLVSERTSLEVAEAEEKANRAEYIAAQEKEASGQKMFDDAVTARELDETECKDAKSRFDNAVSVKENAEKALDSASVETNTRLAESNNCQKVFNDAESACAQALAERDAANDRLSSAKTAENSAMLTMDALKGVLDILDSETPVFLGIDTVLRDANLSVGVMSILYEDQNVLKQVVKFDGEKQSYAEGFLTSILKGTESVLYDYDMNKAGGIEGIKITKSNATMTYDPRTGELVSIEKDGVTLNVNSSAGTLDISLVDGSFLDVSSYDSESGDGIFEKKDADGNVTEHREYRNGKLVFYIDSWKNEYTYNEDGELTTLKKFISDGKYATYTYTSQYRTIVTLQEGQLETLSDNDAVYMEYEGTGADKKLIYMETKGGAYRKFEYTSSSIICETGILKIIGAQKTTVPDDRKMTYGLDFLVRTVNDSDGTLITFEYNDDKTLKQTSILKNGTTYVMRNGKVVETISSDNLKTLYNDSGYVTSVETAPGVYRTYSYDVLSTLMKTISGTSLSGSSQNVEVSTITNGKKISLSSHTDSMQKLLLHFNKTEGYIEVTPVSILLINGAKLDVSNPSLGSGCLCLDGVNDYVSIDDMGMCDFGSSDFTIDMRVNFTELPTADTGDAWLFSQFQNNNTHRWGLHVSGSDTLLFTDDLGSVYNINVSATIPGGIKAGEWHHYAVVRKANEWYFFFDGKMIGHKTCAALLTNQDQPINIGRVRNSMGSYNGFFKGFVDEVRVSNSARWTEDFKLLSEEYTGKICDVNQGTFTMPVRDTNISGSKYISWDIGQYLPEGTTATIKVKSGNSSVLTDGTWGEWLDVVKTKSGSYIIPDSKRYIQMQVVLVTSDLNKNPNISLTNTNFIKIQNLETVSTVASIPDFIKITENGVSSYASVVTGNNINNGIHEIDTTSLTVDSAIAAALNEKINSVSVFPSIGISDKYEEKVKEVCIGEINGDEINNIASDDSVKVIYEKTASGNEIKHVLKKNGDTASYNIAGQEKNSFEEIKDSNGKVYSYKVTYFDLNGTIKRAEIFYADSTKNQVINYENGRIKNVTQNGTEIMTYTYETLEGGREVTVIYDTSSSTAGPMKKYYIDEQLVKTIDKDGIATAYTYDALGKIKTSVLSRSGRQIESYSYAYDTEINYTIITDSSGAKRTYNSDNKILFMEKSGKSYTYYYSDGTTTAQNSDVENIKNALADLNALANANDLLRGTDLANELDSIEDSYTYTPEDNFAIEELTQYTDDDGNIIKFADGDIESITTDAGIVLSGFVMTEGIVTAYTITLPDDMGGSVYTITDGYISLEVKKDGLRTAFYPNGWVKSVTDAVGNETTYVYENTGYMDADGNQCVDQNNKTYVYNTEHRLIKIVDGTNTYTYTKSGNIQTITYSDGKTIKFTYDSKNQSKLTGTIVKEGVKESHYDTSNRLSKVVDTSSGTQYEYFYNGSTISVKKTFTVKQSSLSDFSEYGKDNISVTNYNDMARIQIDWQTDVEYGNGSDGILTVKSGETKVLAAGTYNFEKITVEQNATLTVAPWDKNTNKGGALVIRCLGDVNIDGTVTVDGCGYTGGDGGVLSAGTGCGTGAGTGGTTVESGYNSCGELVSSQDGGGGGGAGHVMAGVSGGGRGGSAGSSYGTSELTDLEIGSGGGGGAGFRGMRSGSVWKLSGGGAGGNGGGAIKIVASTINVNGKLSADGQNGGNGNTASDARTGGGGGGAGGSITLSGERIALLGTITAKGGYGGEGAQYGGNGAAGRIRVDYMSVEGSLYAESSDASTIDKASVKWNQLKYENEGTITSKVLATGYTAVSSSDSAYLTANIDVPLTGKVKVFTRTGANQDASTWSDGWVEATLDQNGYKINSSMNAYFQYRIVMSTEDNDSSPSIYSLDGYAVKLDFVSTTDYENGDCMFESQETFQMTDLPDTSLDVSARVSKVVTGTGAIVSDYSGLVTYTTDVTKDMLLGFADSIYANILSDDEDVLTKYAVEDAGKLVTEYVQKKNGNVEHMDSDGKVRFITDKDGTVLMRNYYDADGNLKETRFWAERDLLSHQLSDAQNEIMKKEIEELQKLADQVNTAHASLDEQVSQAQVEFDSARAEAETMRYISYETQVASFMGTKTVTVTIENPYYADMIAKLDLAETKFHDNAKQAYFGLKNMATVSKNRIKSASLSAYSNLNKQKEVAMTNILKKELTTIIYNYYLKYLGRLPSTSELSSRIDTFAINTDPVNYVYTIDVVALKMELEGMDDRLERVDQINAIVTNVLTEIESYLATEEGKEALIAKLGLTDETLVALTADDWQKVKEWIVYNQKNTMHFGQSAFLVLKTLVDDYYKQHPDLANANENSFDRYVRIAANAMLIDILAGVIDPMTTGDLVLSMYALSKAGKTEGLEINPVKIEWDDLVSLCAKYKAGADEKVIAHVNGNHYVIVTSIDAEGNVTYYEPNMGKDGESVTVSKDEFMKVWEGYALSARAPPAKVMTAFDAQNIRGSNVFMIISVICSIISFALSFIDNKFCQLLSKVFAVIAIVCSVVDIVQSLTSAFQNITKMFEKGFTSFFEATTKAVGTMFSQAANWVKTTFDVANLGKLAADAGMLIVKTVLAIPTSITYTRGFEFMGLDSRFARVASSFLTAGFFTGTEMFQWSLGGAVQGLVFSSLNELGDVFNVPPVITSILSISASALVGAGIEGWVNGFSFVDANGITCVFKPGIDGALQAIGRSLGTTILPNIASELAYYGVQQAFTTLGVPASISYIAGIGIRSSITAGLGGKFDAKTMWDGAISGLKQGITSVALEWASQKLDLDPLIGSLLFRSVEGAIEGFLEYDGNFVQGIIDAAENSFLNIISIGDMGNDPWSRAVALSQLLDFSRIISSNPDPANGLVQALTTYAAGIFNAGTIQGILSQGGIVDMVTNRCEVRDNDEGVRVKRIYFFSGDNEQYLDIAASSNLPIEKRYKEGSKTILIKEKYIRDGANNVKLDQKIIEETLASGIKMVYIIDANGKPISAEIYDKDGNQKFQSEAYKNTLDLDPATNMVLTGRVKDVENGIIYTFENGKLIDTSSLIVGENGTAVERKLSTEVIKNVLFKSDPTQADLDACMDKDSWAYVKNNSSYISSAVVDANVVSKDALQVLDASGGNPIDLNDVMDADDWRSMQQKTSMLKTALSTLLYTAEFSIGNYGGTLASGTKLVLDSVGDLNDWQNIANRTRDFLSYADTYYALTSMALGQTLPPTFSYLYDAVNTRDFWSNLYDFGSNTAANAKDILINTSGKFLGYIVNPFDKAFDLGVTVAESAGTKITMNDLLKALPFNMGNILQTGIMISKTDFVQNVIDKGKDNLKTEADVAGLLLSGLTFLPQTYEKPMQRDLPTYEPGQGGVWVTVHGVLGVDDNYYKSFEGVDINGQRPNAVYGAIWNRLNGADDIDDGLGSLFDYVVDDTKSSYARDAVKTTIIEAYMDKCRMEQQTGVSISFNIYAHSLGNIVFEDVAKELIGYKIKLYDGTETEIQFDNFVGSGSPREFLGAPINRGIINDKDNVGLSNVKNWVNVYNDMELLNKTALTAEASLNAMKNLIPGLNVLPYIYVRKITGEIGSEIPQVRDITTTVDHPDMIGGSTDPKKTQEILDEVENYLQ